MTPPDLGVDPVEGVALPFCPQELTIRQLLSSRATMVLLALPIPHIKRLAPVTGAVEGPNPHRTPLTIL